MDPVLLAVLAADPVTAEGAAGALSSCPQLSVVELDQTPDVLLIIAGEVTDEVLTWIQRAGRSSGDGPPPRSVLVTDRIDDDRLRRAVDAGLASLLRRRDCGSAQITDAVVAAGTGVPPAGALYAFTDGVPGLLPVEPRIGGAGFAIREVGVLRLLADGWETGEIAAMLHYSERTVKNIIQAVLSRHGLRNRTHAVAYAWRSGVLDAVSPDRPPLS